MTDDQTTRWTKTGTATSVETTAGTVLIEQGYQQFQTSIGVEPDAWTAPRPVVAVFVGDAESAKVMTAPEAELVGRALMIASAAAEHSAEVNTP